MEVLARCLVKAIFWILLAAVFVVVAVVVFALPAPAQLAIIVLAHLVQRRSCDDGRQGRSKS